MDITDAPRGVWLNASFRLQRPVTAAEDYPHICSGPWPAQRRDCAACAREQEPTRDAYRGLSRAEFIARTGRAPDDSRA